MIKDSLQAFIELILSTQHEKALESIRVAYHQAALLDYSLDRIHLQMTRC